MAKTAKGLVAYAIAQLGKPYWYGTDGQVANEDLYTYLKGIYPSYYKWDYAGESKKVHDCSGLVGGYLFSETPIDTSIEYDGSLDMTADDTYKACDTKGVIAEKKVPDVPGVIVFYDNHMGVYIGNGEVIEARGHAYGVVKTKLDDRPWLRWGYHPYIDYESEEDYNITYSYGVNPFKTDRNLVYQLGTNINHQTLQPVVSTCMSKDGRYVAVNFYDDYNGNFLYYYEDELYASSSANKYIECYDYSSPEPSEYEVGKVYELSGQQVTLIPKWSNPVISVPLNERSFPIPSNGNLKFTGWEVNATPDKAYIKDNTLYIVDQDYSSLKVYATWGSEEDSVEVTVKHGYQKLDSPNEYNIEYTETIHGTSSTLYTINARPTKYGFYPVPGQQVQIQLGDYKDSPYLYKYDRNNYTVEFGEISGISITASWGDNKASDVTEILVPFQSEVTLGCNLSRGYRFDGWSYSDSLADIFSTDTTIVRNITDSIKIYALASRVSATNIGVNVMGKQMAACQTLFKSAGVWTNIKNIYVKESGSWKTK